MNLANIVLLVIQSSIFLLVFSLGLAAQLKDSLYFFQRPQRLLKALLAMNFIFPVTILGLMLLFDFKTPVKIALIALALSPIPPLLPHKQLKTRAESSYIIGLLVAISLFSIILIPLMMKLLGIIFTRELNISPWPVAKLILLTVLIPLTLGMTVRHLVPSFAEKKVKLISQLGFSLLLLAVLPLLALTSSSMLSLLGDGTILAMLVFSLLGLITGHLLGGPASAERGTLALATASRHPGIALTLAVTHFPEQKKIILAAILLYLIVSAVLSLFYLKWQRHSPQRSAHLPTRIKKVYH